MTASELLDELSKDKVYRAMIEEKKRKASALRALLKQEQASLLREIQEKSNKVCETVWDLVNATWSYPDLIEVLIDHASRPYHFRTREGIARALTVKEARGTIAPLVLVQELWKCHSPNSAIEESYRFSLVNALLYVGDSRVLNDILAMQADDRFKMIGTDLHRLAKVLSRKSKIRKY
jgi:hypothetical protein